MLKFVTILVLTAGLSSANTIIFFTSSGTSGEVDFTPTAGQLVITLKNLNSGNTTVAQNITDIEFLLSTGILNGSTTMTSSASEITCTGGLCTPANNSVATGWGFGTATPPSLPLENTICAVCMSNSTLTIATATGVPPKHTLVGPNPVDTGSLDTGSHNPMLDQTATFTLSNASITALTTISGVNFSFGTQPDAINVTGCASGSPGCGGNVLSTPEPADMFLMGFGLLGVGVLLKFRRA